MAETDIEKFGVLAKFKISHDVKDFDATGDGRSDEELVALGRELNALADALGVYRVEQSRGFGGDVDHSNAVVVGAQPGGHDHFAVGMKRKTLDTIGDLLDDFIDDRFFKREVGNQNIAEINSIAKRSLADESLFAIWTDS